MAKALYFQEGSKVVLDLEFTKTAGGKEVAILRDPDGNIVVTGPEKGLEPGQYRTITDAELKAQQALIDAENAAKQAATDESDAEKAADKAADTKDKSHKK